MKTTKALVHTFYREEDFDVTDFFHLKDMARAQGITSDKHTLLCGNMAYKRIENHLLDHIKAYTNIPKELEPLQPEAHVFMVNGITYYIYLITGIPDWTVIILYDRVDIKTEKFW